MWPRYLPDLTLWHAWHAGRGTLPDPWKGLDLPGVCRLTGTAAWTPRRPWRAELPGIEVHDRQDAGERVLTWRTPSGTLTSRWILGPDGDWWQSEYPVKSSADLDAALAVAGARRYVPGTAADAEPAAAGSGRVEMMPGAWTEPIELPQRPWSELLHAFFGWSDGLMLMLEEPAAVQGIAEVLEEKLGRLEEELARSGAALAFSPDNLDSQFIQAETFAEHLSASYTRAASVLHRHGMGLVVHAGGPVLPLLPALAACGVDCVEGVCGPPQGDAPFAEARRAAGPSLILWGGIAQDYMLPGRPETELQAAAEEAFAWADSDPAWVVGVADKVPTEAVPARLTLLSRLAASRRG
jgi:hypothetical protein